MAVDDDIYNVQRFNGRTSDGYSLWRIKAVTALKVKCYWTRLLSAKCPDEIKDKASAILINALGDTALRVSSSEISQPIKMFELLDRRFSSTLTSSRISILSSLYSKEYNSNQNMAK